METVAALFSGFVAGAAVGVLGLGVFGSLLVTVPTTNWLRQQFPDPSNWVMVSLGAALVAQAGSAVLGMLLGVVFLNVADGGSSGLGSPSWQFTAGIVISIALARDRRNPHVPTLVATIRDDFSGRGRLLWLDAAASRLRLGASEMHQNAHRRCVYSVEQPHSPLELET